jgi:hypothetical protein
LGRQDVFDLSNGEKGDHEELDGVVSVAFEGDLTIDCEKTYS